jgi:CO/xanthine dehydrogenase FAD-binding subunit
MIAQSFEYESPRSIAETVSLLQKYGDEAKILSGGHSLIPMMKLRFARPAYVIDINNIPVSLISKKKMDISRSVPLQESRKSNIQNC